MPPYHRNVLLEALYALDHLIWSYRSELDQSASALLTSDDLCLADFANRAASLARKLIDQDNGQQGRDRTRFKPPSPYGRRSLDAAIAARRAKLAAAASCATTSTAIATEVLPTLDHGEPDNGAPQREGNLDDPPERNTTDSGFVSPRSPKNRMRPR
jgi:hypothetical protein